ncbi:MAG: hypothetical protein PF694_09280 [Bacteroidetes bacterium]|jgi:hypothetical protein|nr:hypothetical protein [Bacteroidota bacterium]
MMKKTFFFLSIVLLYFFSACQPDDKKIENKKWVLFSRDHANSNQKEHFKQKDEKLTFYFSSDGRVIITTKKPDRYYVGLWQRNTKNKDLIEINCEDTLINFYTTGIYKDMLTRTILESEMVLECYRIENDSSWPSDELIDAMNSTSY